MIIGRSDRPSHEHLRDVASMHTRVRGAVPFNRVEETLFHGIMASKRIA